MNKRQLNGPEPATYRPIADPLAAEPRLPPAFTDPLCRSNGKRHDGASFMELWSGTSVGCYMPHGHIALASREPGLVAEQTEQQKKTKYVDLLTTHYFVPIGIECLVPKPSLLSRSLVVASGPVLVNPFLSTFFCNRLESPFSEGTPLQWSALMNSVLILI